MFQEFWVVGGSYRDANFADLHEGSGELYGPFTSYDQALTSWRDRTAKTRSQATVRYSVVVTASRRPVHAA